MAWILSGAYSPVSLALRYGVSALVHAPAAPMLLAAFALSTLYLRGSLGWQGKKSTRKKRSGVQLPVTHLAALTSAPASMSICTTSSLPELAAMWIGRTPLRTLLTGCPCIKAYLTRPAGRTRRPSGQVNVRCSLDPKEGLPHQYCHWQQPSAAADPGCGELVTTGRGGGSTSGGL